MIKTQPPKNQPKNQFGQSMTEYTIVLVFGVLALTTGPGGDVMQELLQVIKNNYSGYSFGASLSEPPDYDDVDEYRDQLALHGFSDEEIERLAVDTPELYKKIQYFNKDPAEVLKKMKQDIKDAAKNAAGGLIP